MTCVIPALVAHYADVADEMKAFSGDRHNDLTSPPVTVRGFRICYCHYDREACPISRRREPFMTVDDVIVSVLYSRCAHPTRIGARMFGFRHRKTTAHVAANQRLQILLALHVGSVRNQYLHIADVGRLTVKEIVT